MDTHNKYNEASPSHSPRVLVASEIKSSFAGNVMYSRIGETRSMAAPASVNSIKVKIINSQSCILSWTQAEEGCVPLKGYFIEQMRLDGFGWARINDIVTEKPIYLVNGLIPGRRYRFRVITEDIKGGQSQGKETEIIQPFERPHPPSSPIVYDVTQHSCFLEWNPPDWDGGIPITNYLIEMQTGYCSSWKTICRVDEATFAKRIDGLVVNSKYTFQIIAVNKIGKSCPSPVSQIIKAAGNDVTDDTYLASLDDTKLETWGLQCVSKSFSRGIERISSVVELIQKQSHCITYWAEQKLATELKTFAAIADANMQNASSQLESLNKELNKRLEALVRDKGQKENELHKKEREISKVCKEIKEMEKQLEKLRIEKLKAEADFFKAEEQVKQAEEQLRKQKRKKKRARGLGAIASVATGFAFGPVAGLAVGGLTFAACKNMDDVVRTAREIRNIAEQNRDRLRKRLEDKKGDISKAQTDLSKRKAERDAINVEIEIVKEKIKCMQQRTKKTTDISSNIKQCSTYVSITEGRTEVLHDQARFLYCPGTILGPLRELVSHLSLPEAGKLGQLLSGSKVELMLMKIKMIAEADRKWKETDLLSHEQDLQVSVGSKNGKKVVETIATVDKVTGSISTYKDALEDAAMLLSHTTGWEQLLSPAPLTLAFLGQLLLLSLKTDVSLHVNRPEGGFQQLRQPESFRASIIQIVNDGWKAFNTAHVNMDQIRIYLQTLPEHLTSAFDILSMGSNAEVANFLHLPLTAIKVSSEKCLQKARQTETGIMTVVKLIAELQEICVLTKGHYESEHTKTKASLHVAREEVAMVEEEKRLLETRRLEFRETILEAERQFDNAITSLPGGWNIFGMAVVDAISSTVTASLKLLTKPFKKTKAKGRTGASNQLPSADQESRDTKIRLVHEQAVICQNIVASLVSYLGGSGKHNLGKVANGSQIAYCLSQIRFVMDRMKKINDCPAKKQLETFCEGGITLCQRLQTEHNAFVPDKNKIKTIADETLLLQTSIRSFVDKLKISVDSTEESKAPSRKSWQVPDCSGKGMVKYELENAKSKVEQTCTQLEYAQLRYDEVSKSIHEANTRLSILLGVITRMDMECLSVADIIDLLGRGLVVLAELRQPWGRLVHFFGSMSNLIDSTLNVTLKIFVDTTAAGNSTKAGGYAISHFRRDMIYHQAMLAAEISNFVSVIAASYTNISTDYVLPSIEMLLELLKFDPETQKEELRLHLQALMTKCETAQQNINNLIDERKKDFRVQLESRIERLRLKEKQKLVELEDTIQRLPDTCDWNTEDLNPDDFV